MKRPPQRILCATDLGPGGDRAVIEADAWARRHGASLEFVYAVPEASRTHVLFPQIAHRTMAAFPAFAQRASDAVAERVEQLTARPRADVNIEVDIGSPASIIVTIAEEMQADLVVIGAVGADEADGRLGSIARRVIQHSPCPVLLARGAPRGGPVLVASDLSDTTFPTIVAGAIVANSLETELSVMHVVDLPTPMAQAPEGARFGFGYALTARELQLLEEGCRDRLGAAMAHIGVKGLTFVEHGAPAPSVAGAARRLDARLLVIGTEGRTNLSRMLLGSTAEQILREAPCPVLVVRLHARRLES